MGNQGAGLGHLSGGQCCWMHLWLPPLSLRTTAWAQSHRFLQQGMPVTLWREGCTIPRISPQEDDLGSVMPTCSWQRPQEPLESGLHLEQGANAARGLSPAVVEAPEGHACWGPNKTPLPLRQHSKSAFWQLNVSPVDLCVSSVRLCS